MKLRKCFKCFEYTLKESCPSCGSETQRVEPARFSLDDPYGKYRRMMKKEENP